MQYFKATIINPQSNGNIEFFVDGLLVIDSKGKIEFCGDSDKAKTKYFSKYELISKSAIPAGIIIPSLIDTHVHLPQLRVAGCGTGELMDWLNNFIFPLENKFANDAFARHYSEIFFDQLIQNGTTAAAIYCSNHKNAVNIAFQQAEKVGIRSFIGQSLMDCKSPDYLISDLPTQKSDVIAMIEKWHGHDDYRLNYILSPRFAGSCSEELMRFAGEVSKSENLFIQTHLSENKNEIEFIKSLFPKYESYTAIYEDMGLLTPRSLLGHCIHLDSSEQELIRKAGSVMVHCPSSNRYLMSGIMPLTDYIDSEHRVTLGSDVGAGPQLSMLAEAKEALESSKTRKMLIDNMSRLLTAQEAFHLATIAGASALGIDHLTGNLNEKKEADFLCIEPDAIMRDIIKDNDEEAILGKLIYGYGEIREVYVRGEKVSKAK